MTTNRLRSFPAFVTLAVLAALASACARPPTAPSSDASPEPSYALTPVPTGSGAPPAADQSRFAASRFAAAWVQDSTDLAAWRTNLAKHTTRSYAKQIANLSPGPRPATKRTGPYQIVGKQNEQITYTTTTDTGTLRIVTIPDGFQWKVSASDFMP